MPGAQNPQPKPFFWIALEGKPEPTKEGPAPHHRFSGLSGCLELEIEVRSDYLYVGSGQIELFDHHGREQAYFAFARRNGQLIIPGTSIKGAVRSVVEAISNSCVKLIGRGERLPASHQPCQGEDALCPACRLFGTTGYRGRVRFADAVPVGDVRPSIVKIADLWPPSQIRGRKFYRSRQFQALDPKPAKNHRFLEAAPKGSKFRSVLYFENASSAEMGLLIRALGLDRSPNDPSKVAYVVPIKLGGAKPRCLGSVRFIPKALRLLQDGPGLPASLLDGGVPVPITGTLLGWLEDETLLDRDAWDQFRRNAKAEEGFCPEGVY